MNMQFTPVDPEERGKLWLSMLNMVKADLKTGAFTDWGICYDTSAGYAFSELAISRRDLLLGVPNFFQGLKQWWIRNLELQCIN